MLAQSAEGQTGNPDSWLTEEFNADWGLQAIGAHYAYARGLTGGSIRLGVFDSGVDLGHGEFAGKANNGIRIADRLEDGACSNSVALDGPDACFMSDGDTVAIDYFHYTDEDRALVQYLVDIGYLYDWVPEYLESIAGAHYSTHGTHVAGTMVANRDGSGTHGVAFGANLTSARLFSNSYFDLYNLLGAGGESYAIGPDGSAVAGMYAQMAALGVRAINHSWGLSQEPRTAGEMDGLYYSEGVPEYFATYADPSLQHGIIQVFAAGNGYGDIAGIYATLPRYRPELEPYWLSVVNLNASGRLDESSSICGLSKDWCVTAPGTDITSTVVDGEIDAEVVRDADGNFVGIDVKGADPLYGYGDLTGTSMAAPHVTGALALLMERFPYLDNPQVRDVLLTTATDLGAAGVDEIYGWGLVDLKKAIEGPGLLRVDTNVVMNQRAGGLQVWAGPAWDDWTNDIGGPGRLTKSGIGWLRLSGDNTFAGATVDEGVLELDGDNALTGDVLVNGGHFVLNGRLTGSNLTVDGGSAHVNGVVRQGTTSVGTGARLGGIGTLADTTVHGTIAPGNSIGTLTIDGAFTQAAGSFFEVELSPTASDHLQVNGTATLEGGTVRAIPLPGMFRLGHTYNLISATGGIVGHYAGVDASAISPFLHLNLVYGVNDLDLRVLRGQALASAGTTWNQRSTGAALDGLADENALLQAMVQLFPQQASAAMDQLSGELHASTHAALADTSRHVRNAALGRARHGYGGFTAQVVDDQPFGAWIEVQDAGGHIGSDGNAARTDYSGHSTLVGADYRFGNGWRVGLLAGTGRTDVAAGTARSDIDMRQVGLYAGQQWGRFGLRGGAAQAWSDIDSHRAIDFPGFREQERAGYDTTTRQAFVEAAYGFGAASWEVEPFVQYARVQVDGDAFAESGGIAALRGRVEDTRLDLATGGVRFNANLKAARQEQTWLSLRGSVGYRHAGGDLTPSTEVSLPGSGAFDIRGASLDADSMLIEGGIAARLSAHSLLELGYSGQFGDEARDHGANARFSVQF